MKLQGVVQCGIPPLPCVQRAKASSTRYLRGTYFCAALLAAFRFSLLSFPGLLLCMLQASLPAVSYIQYLIFLAIMCVIYAVYSVQVRGQGPGVCACVRGGGGTHSPGEGVSMGRACTYTVRWPGQWWHGRVGAGILGAHPGRRFFLPSSDTPPPSAPPCCRPR